MPSHEIIEPWISWWTLLPLFLLRTHSNFVWSMMCGWFWSSKSANFVIVERMRVVVCWFGCIWCEQCCHSGRSSRCFFNLRSKMKRRFKESLFVHNGISWCSEYVDSKASGEEKERGKREKKKSYPSSNNFFLQLEEIIVLRYTKGSKCAFRALLELCSWWSTINRWLCFKTLNRYENTMLLTTR